MLSTQIAILVLTKVITPEEATTLEKVLGAMALPKDWRGVVADIERTLQRTIYQRDIEDSEEAFDSYKWG